MQTFLAVLSNRDNDCKTDVIEPDNYIILYQKLIRFIFGQYLMYRCVKNSYNKRENITEKLSYNKYYRI